MKKSLFQFGCAILAVLVAFQPLAWADTPAGVQTTGVSGWETIADADGNVTTTITTNSNQAMIDWMNLSIAKNETLKFIMPDATSSVLNTITGSAASDIWGGIIANGRVFFININGINIHEGANIDTAMMIASTLSLSKADFLAGQTSGNYHFEKVLGSQIGKILNEANLSGKDIALIAEQIKNTGVIEVNLGKVFFKMVIS